MITGFYYLSIQNETKIIICSIGASIVGNKLILFFQLDLALKDENGGDISSFITNGEWDLLGNFGCVIYRNKHFCFETYLTNRSIFCMVHKYRYKDY